MKVILLITSCFIIFFSLAFLKLLPFYLFDSYIERNVIYNYHESSVTLYEENPSSFKVVGYLKPKENIPFQYKGVSGAWVYGLYKGQTVSLRDENLTESHLVLGYPVDEEEIYVVLFLAILILFISIVFIFIGFLNRKAKINKEISYKNQKYYELDRIKSERDAYKRKNSSLEKINKALNVKNQSQKKEAKRKLDHEISQLVKKESVIRKQNVTISTLEKSKCNLENQLERIYEEAAILGVDYKNTYIDNIIKGRVYELHVAKSLCEYGYEILEWTPDKGIPQGISVKTNQNPDLVVRKGKNTFAIECKYRNAGIPKKNLYHKDEINWAASKSLKKYHAFSNNREIKVYLGLGFWGNPDSPQYEYLVSLNDIEDLSESPRKIRDWGEQQIIRRSKLANFLVKNNNYSSRL